MGCILAERSPSVLGHIDKLMDDQCKRAIHSQALRSAVYRLDVNGQSPAGVAFNIAESRPRTAGGSHRRYRRSLNHKLCRLGIGRCYYFDPFGTLREIKVFGFWGEYGRKAET